MIVQYGRAIKIIIQYDTFGNNNHDNECKAQSVLVFTNTVLHAIGVCNSI